MDVIGNGMEIVLTKLSTANRCGLCIFRCKENGACGLNNIFVSEYMRACRSFDRYVNLVDTVATLDHRLQKLYLKFISWSYHAEQKDRDG